MIDLPLPRGLLVLWLAMPLVVVAGRQWAAHLTRDRALRVALTPVLALAAWLLAIHCAGLLARSFVVGFACGTLAIAFAAGVSLTRPARAALGRRVRPVALLSVAIAGAPIAWMALLWAFHDEDLMTGHMSIAAEIQNGVYPPRHLTFPSVALHYHYGFDLLVACITALTRAPVDRGIDIAAILLWGCTGTVLWGIGNLWFRRGWVVVFVAIFAGGVPMCMAKRAPFAKGLLGLCQVAGVPALAPMDSMFFQHPWSLGLPLALAMALVFSAYDRVRSGPRLALLALLGAALSLSQVVLFMTMVPSLVAAELWRLRGHRRSRAAIGTIGAVGLAIGIAFMTGAIDGPIFGENLMRSVALTAGVAHGGWTTALWHLQSYGLMLPVALAGLSFLPRRGRALVAVLLFGALAALNLVQYRLSSDATKLGTVAELAMSLSAAALVARLLRSARGPRASRRVGFRALAIGAFVGATAGGVSNAAMFLWPGTRRYYAHEVPRMSPDDARAASFLRARIGPGEMVYRKRGPAAGYAQWAGLPVPWSDWATAAFGFSPERLRARAAFLRELPREPLPYLEEGLDWFVLDAEDTRLGEIADQWVKGGAAKNVATLGALRIVRLSSLGH